MKQFLIEFDITYGYDFESYNGFCRTETCSATLREIVKNKLVATNRKKRLLQKNVDGRSKETFYIRGDFIHAKSITNIKIFELIELDIPEKV